MTKFEKKKLALKSIHFKKPHSKNVVNFAEIKKKTEKK